MRRALVLSSLALGAFFGREALAVVASDIVHLWTIQWSYVATDKKPSGDVANPDSDTDTLDCAADHKATSDSLVSGDGKWQFDAATKRFTVNFTNAADVHFAHYSGAVNVKSFKLKSVHITNAGAAISGKIRGKFKCTDQGLHFTTKVKGSFAGGNL